MPHLDREFTFQEMRRHNMPFWKILSNKKMISSCVESTHDVEAQIHDLNTQLNYINASFVDVIISTVTDKELGAGNPKGKTKEHTIQLHKAVQNDRPNVEIVSGYSENNVNALMEVERAKHQLEIEKMKFAKNQELELLKSEIAKLREDFMAMEDDDDDESIGGIEKVWAEAKPYLPYILTSIGVMPKPKAMAEDVNKIVVEHEHESTPGQTPGQTNVEDDQVKKISNACRRILKFDSNGGDNLLKLAEFGELNPDGYFAILPMLEMQLQILKQNQNGGQ